MTNQYIVQYTNTKDDTNINGFAELIKTDYNIPILNIRSHEDKNNRLNKTYLYQFLAIYKYPQLFYHCN